MRRVTLTCVDAVHNHHKFWIGKVLADGNLKVFWVQNIINFGR
jgi:hypothetical protein